MFVLFMFVLNNKPISQKYLLNYLDNNILRSVVVKYNKKQKAKTLWKIQIIISIRLKRHYLKN